MTQRHREILAKLDSIAVNRYQITEKDIQAIEQYLRIIQRRVKGGSTWQDIQIYPSAYATSVVIHEIVEIRRLEELGIQPLKLKTKALQAALAVNEVAHVAATYEEHLYLQEIISRQFQQHFEVATLILANRGNWIDLEMFLESDIGVYLLEEDKVEQAAEIIAKLKGEQT